MKLDWTDIAVLDLENIKDYISRDSIFYANRFIEKIISAVEPLKKFINLQAKVLMAFAFLFFNSFLRHFFVK